MQVVIGSSYFVLGFRANENYIFKTHIAERKNSAIIRLFKVITLFFTDGFVLWSHLSTVFKGLGWIRELVLFGCFAQIFLL
jgi:hypothetical protein